MEYFYFTFVKIVSTWKPCLVKKSQEPTYCLGSKYKRAWDLGVVRN